MKKCREYRIPLYTGYIDYKKPFGSVETAVILNVLREFRTKKKYARTVEDISKSCNADINFKV